MSHPTKCVFIKATDTKIVEEIDCVIYEIKHLLASESKTVISQEQLVIRT